MAKLVDFLPNADAIIALGPEDLGMLFLRVLRSRWRADRPCSPKR